MPVKLIPWLLSGVLLVVAQAIASVIPNNKNITPSTGDLGGSAIVQPQENPPVNNIANNSSPDSQIVARKPTNQTCQDAGSAVVTIHAGRAFGSGSIVAPEGLVITNNHVVKPSRDGQVGVRTANGTRYDGQVVAVDPENDLALIKMEVQDRLPVIRLGNPQDIKMGQPVCAIGSPFGHPGVLTKGTLTTVRRNGDFQSALLLEPGNSGGPLLNAQGEMIGINKAIWQSRSGVNSGISFATNIEAAKNFINQNAGLVASRGTGSYKSNEQAKAFTGGGGYPQDNPSSVTVPSEPIADAADMPPDRKGGAQLGVVLDKDTLTVQQVEPVSAAAAAGLKSGDRLVAINGNQLQGVDQLQQFLSSQPTSAVITINRNQQTQKLQINF
jgi:serine protease Do